LVFNYRKTDISVSLRIDINLYSLYFVAFQWIKNSVREGYRSVREVYRSVREAYGKCKGVILKGTGVTQKSKGGLQKCK